MSQFTWLENLHLAGYLELLMDERHGDAPRAPEPLLGSEPQGSDAGEDLHAHMPPLELHAWRYLIRAPAAPARLPSG